LLKGSFNVSILGSFTRTILGRNVLVTAQPDILTGMLNHFSLSTSGFRT